MKTLNLLSKINYKDIAIAYRNDPKSPNLTANMLRDLKIIRSCYDEGPDMLSLVYSRIPLIRNAQFKVDTTETLRNITDISIDDTLWTREQIQASIKYLAYVPWGSAFGGVSQNKNKRWNCFTPPFLAGHKRFNSVKYNEWTRESLAYILPKAMHVFPLSVDLSDVDIHAARDKARTISTTGDKKPFTEYRCNATGIPQIDSLPKTVRSMYMQLWIFNVACRNDYMILDVDDWDLIPKALDSVEKTLDSVEKTLDSVEKSSVDDGLPW